MKKSVYNRKQKKRRSKTVKRVTIYTDGACSGNPGPGGFCAILVYLGKERCVSGGEARTTNNRMELLAVISALQLLKEPCEVEVVSDSQYVVNAIEKGWLKAWAARGWKKADRSPVLNAELWKLLIPLLERHRVGFTWIRGHAGHPYNERCDAIARAQSQTK